MCLFKRFACMRVLSSVEGCLRTACYNLQWLIVTFPCPNPRVLCIAIPLAHIVTDPSHIRCATVTLLPSVCNIPHRFSSRLERPLWSYLPARNVSALEYFPQIK